MLVDSHCHLDFPELNADLAGVLSRMHDNGVTHALTISTTLETFPAVRAVAHAHAKDAMALGFHISFSGIVTFKNAKDLKEVARRVPLERMLVETDSPYLAPVPHRGKPNQPAFVKHVADEIAALRGIAFEDVARAT